MNNKFYDYDAVVLGGGLSGCEAATTAARGGIRTLLISINMDSVAVMQFGNLIWLDRFKDLFRVLENIESKTPRIIRDNTLIKVKAKRNNFERLKGSVVIDKKRFVMDMKRMIESHTNLETRQGLAVNILKKKTGYEVETSDLQKFKARSIIVCAGTYLDAKINWGENILKAGKPGEICSSRLYHNLKKIGMKFEKKSLFSAPKIIISSTVKDSKRSEIIKYCKSELCSISSKSWANKANNTGRRIFLVPEGKETEEMYVLGFENNLSEEEQLTSLMEIMDFKDSYMTRPGYEIEYACLAPSLQGNDLQVKGFAGIFFAGRVSGSMKYEESLAYGALAGINARNFIKREKTLKLSEIRNLLGNGRN